eukprot:Hpha_TRINITY_DN14905_c2_g3::TRINITY_DN14905_c2_g3_i2::g.144629::m.144629
MGSTCGKGGKAEEKRTVTELRCDNRTGELPTPAAGHKRKVKSWKMDTVKGMKKDDLAKLSGTVEGRKQLQQLKEELDKCVEWCNRYCEDEGTDMVSAQGSVADDGGKGAEACKEKHEEFQKGLEAM